MRPPFYIGIVMLLISTLWVADVGRFTSSYLSALYSAFGKWMWFGGSERSYIVFNRYVTGGIGVAISLAWVLAEIFAH